MMRSEIKTISIRAAATYIVAFVLLYLLACWAAALPAVSPASLSVAFDTLGKKLRFASALSICVLVIASPVLILAERWDRKRKDRPNQASEAIAPQGGAQPQR